MICDRPILSGREYMCAEYLRELAEMLYEDHPMDSFVVQAQRVAAPTTETGRLQDVVGRVDGISTLAEIA